MSPIDLLKTYEKQLALYRDPPHFSHSIVVLYRVWYSVGTYHTLLQRLGDNTLYLRVNLCIYESLGRSYDYDDSL